MDRLISQADGEKNNELSVSQLMVLRHILKSPSVLNDEDVYLDVLGLQGDMEEAAGTNADPPRRRYVDDFRRPKQHSFYRKQKRA